MTPAGRVVVPIVAAIPLAILSAAVGCTWALAHGASQLWRVPFRLFCHGIPRRCLELWHTPMPLCARCCAIYAGILLGLALFWLLPAIGEKPMRTALLIALLPMAIDGLTQGAQLRESTNQLRLITGSISGLALAGWLISALRREREEPFTSS